jgi:hypothetical protein
MVELMESPEADMKADWMVGLKAHLLLAEEWDGMRAEMMGLYLVLLTAE